MAGCRNRRSQKTSVGLRTKIRQGYAELCIAARRPRLLCMSGPNCLNRSANRSCAKNNTSPAEINLEKPTANLKAAFYSQWHAVGKA